MIGVRPIDRPVGLGPSAQGQIPRTNQNEVALDPSALSAAEEVDGSGESRIRPKDLPHRRNGEQLGARPGKEISAPRRPCLTRPEAASTVTDPYLAFAYCGLSMIRVIAGLKGSSCSPALPAWAIPASAMIPNTPNARPLRQSGMVTPKPPSSSAMASAVNSVRSASCSISGVPGSAEHPHPVASQDFRDVDERVAVAQQFRAEEWEVRYLIEILDVLE